MFLAIRNRGSMNRLALTLFGFSTKGDRMDDPTIVGNKGSGLKLAALAAVRLGLKVYVSSSDVEGRYLLSYEVEHVPYDTGSVRRIMLAWTTMDAAGSVVHVREPWNMTPQAFRDWDKPIGSDRAREFKMFREYVANASDEDKEFRMSMDDRVVVASEGETAVFIQWAEGLRYLLTQKERYFKFLRPIPSPVHIVRGHGTIYPKSDLSATRFFVNGVMVECTTDPFRRSQYDYSLDDKTLVSEDRIIRDHTRFLMELGSMFVNGVQDPTLAKNIAAAALGSSTESSALGTISSVPSGARRVFWRDAFAEALGTQDFCLPSGHTIIDADAEQIRGFLVLRVVPMQTQRFLALIGVRTAKDLVPPPEEERHVAFSELAPDQRMLFLREYRLLRKHFPSLARWPYRFYEDCTGTDRRLGYCLIDANDPVVSLRVMRDSDGYAFAHPEEVRATLRHEGRHLATRRFDYDRGFMAAAECEADLLLARFEGESALPNGTSVPRLDRTADTALPLVLEPDGGTAYAVIYDDDGVGPVS